MNTHYRRSVLLAAVIVLISAGTAAAIEIDFKGFDAGQVIAGQEPNGDKNPGTELTGIVMSVQNTGGGPNSLMVFDSANPSGDDLDLGTPNETCPGGGPGVGIGGEVGQPGENCTPLGKIVMVAENIVDADGDNRADDPDDEAGGGIITFEFDGPIIFLECTFIDIDETGGTVKLYDGPTLLATEVIAFVGDNSAQTVSFAQYMFVDKVEVQMTGSGSVGRFLYEFIVPVEQASWGGIKSSYR